jgi:hypothetical protein
MDIMSLKGKVAVLKIKNFRKELALCQENISGFEAAGVF